MYCVFVAYAVHMLCHSPQIRAVPSMPIGGLQKWSWENEISHLLSDPAQSPCTVFMLELLVKTDILECRSHGFSPALCFLSLTNICLQQSKADVFSVSFHANSAGLCVTPTLNADTQRNQKLVSLYLDKYLIRCCFWDHSKPECGQNSANWVLILFSSLLDERF